MDNDLGVFVKLCVYFVWHLKLYIHCNIAYHLVLCHNVYEILTLLNEDDSTLHQMQTWLTLSSIANSYGHTARCLCHTSEIHLPGTELQSTSYSTFSINTETWTVPGSSRIHIKQRTVVESACQLSGKTAEAEWMKCMNVKGRQTKLQSCMSIDNMGCYKAWSCIPMKVEYDWHHTGKQVFQRWNLGFMEVSNKQLRLPMWIPLHHILKSCHNRFFALVAQYESGNIHITRVCQHTYEE